MGNGMASASDDAARYRSGYPGQIDPPLAEARQNLDFYTGVLVSRPDGVSISKFHASHAEGGWFGDYEAHDDAGGGAALILIGVLMCAVGSISQNLGNNIMSLGHRKKAEHEEKSAAAEAWPGQKVARPAGGRGRPRDDTR